jgi:tetratricopeptide (TPR) repeat protein
VGRIPSAPASVEAVLSLAVTAEEELLGEAHPSCVARLSALGPRLGEALDWSAEHDPERGLALAAALWRYFLVSGELRDGRQHLGWLLGLVPAPSEARLRGLVSSALLAAFAGEHAEAVLAAGEGLPLARALDDELRLAYLALVLAWSAQAQGEAGTATGHFEEALERFRDARHRWGTATALLGLGEVARARGAPGRARPLSAEALGLFGELHDDSSLAASRVNLGLVSLELGALEEAQGHLAEAVRTGEALGNRTFLAGAVLGLSALRRLEGRPEAAARLLGESHALLVATGAAFEPADRLLAEREEAELRRSLGARYESEWRRGQRAPEAADRERLAR